MAVAYTQETFETGKQILAFPEPYVCVAHTFLKGDTRATDVNGKKIIKAGTVYPANGATAVGIVFNDYDVTDGDVSGAILLEGYVKKLEKSKADLEKEEKEKNKKECDPEKDKDCEKDDENEDENTNTNTNNDDNSNNDPDE